MWNKIRSSLNIKIFIGTFIVITLFAALEYNLIKRSVIKEYNGGMEEFFGETFDDVFYSILSQQKATGYAMLVSIQNDGTFTKAKESYDKAVIVQVGSKAYKLQGLYESVLDETNDTVSLTFSGNTENIEKIELMEQVYVKILPFLIGVILLISILISYVYSGIVSRPVIAVSRRARALAGESLGEKYEVERTDEIGQLTESLNEMSVTLARTFDDLKSANEKLSEDIFREQKQEQQRRELFTAISHELKTPVTVLKGEIEGMIHRVGTYKDRDRYLRHTYKTVQSIEEMIKEIMSVAKMELKEFEIKKTECNISSIMLCSLGEHKELADKKGIEIRSKIDTDVYYSGDERLLGKALSNIVGNAIFHTPEEQKVNISLNKGDEHSVLSVENFGVIMTEEQTMRVFELFYRADLSRSRDFGGSGLGLYLVKNIFDKHHIFYEIKAIDNGVQFVVCFEHQEKGQE